MIRFSKKLGDKSHISLKLSLLVCMCWGGRVVVTTGRPSVVILPLHSSSYNVKLTPSLHVFGQGTGR